MACPPTGRKFQITGVFATMGDRGIARDKRLHDATNMLCSWAPWKTKPME